MGVEVGGVSTREWGGRPRSHDAWGLPVPEADAPPVDRRSVMVGGAIVVLVVLAAASGLALSLGGGKELARVAGDLAAAPGEVPVVAVDGAAVAPDVTHTVGNVVLSRLQVRQDAFADFELTGEARATGPPRRVTITASFLSGDRIVGRVDATVDLDQGAAIPVTLTGTDDYTRAFDRIDVEVTGDRDSVHLGRITVPAGTAAPVAGGSPAAAFADPYTVGDVTFSDIEVRSDRFDHFEVAATAETTGGARGMTVTAAMFAGDVALGEVSTLVYLRPGNPDRLRLIGFADYAAYDRVEFKVDEW